MDNKNNVGRIAGKTVLFIGIECRNWSVEQFAQAAREARALGIDTISPKRLDGTVRWYGTPQHLQEEAKAVNAAGCGYLPFAYCYGPRFGLGFVNEECAVLTEMQDAMGALQPDGIGFVCADLEIEYNGQVEAAKRFNAAMQNKHLLYLTSWADPQWQSWAGVLNELRGCINCYIPQSYNDQLNNLERIQVPNDLVVQVAVDVSYEFGGGNHPVVIAQQRAALGDTTVWIWDYSFLGSFRSNVSGVVQAMSGVKLVGDAPQSVPAPAPTPAQPAPIQERTVTVEPGDSLSVIAQRVYNNGNEWGKIFDANRDKISDPNHIEAGWVLRIPA